MVLKLSGQISIGGSVQSESINLEICRSATAQTDLNETFLRTFAGVPSGQISLSDFYNKKKSTISLTASQSTVTNACYGPSANVTYYFGADTKLFQTELCTAANTGYYGTGTSTYYQVTSVDGTYTGPTACPTTTTTTTTAGPNCGSVTCIGAQVCCQDVGDYCCESGQDCCFGTCVPAGTCT